ncbi:hypothetical protein TNCV_3163531 [Trichonephila clavipes]|nr:hypothetical protein TNCV_3163531 [Trichonephila clavipes]
MPYNQATCPLSMICIMKIHRHGAGIEPAALAAEASDNPTTSPAEKIENYVEESQRSFCNHQVRNLI